MGSLDWTSLIFEKHFIKCYIEVVLYQNQHSELLLKALTRKG